MNESALTLESLGKSFRVAHAAGDADPRREPLSRRHDRFHALREVSFELERGQTLGLIGANGSGKSTLLKILSGVMTPSAGSFAAQGRVGALLELGAGFHPDLSGVENVYLNAALLGLGARETDRLLPEIIAFAELERFMDLPVRHFSSGMAARLGFAVATRLAPDLLLMDETFAAGDAGFQSKALAHMAEMKRRGHTLLIVSHSMEIVLTLCDRAAWLDRGRLRRIGRPVEVVAEYQRSQRMNLHGSDLLRGALGMESLFTETLGADSPLRIACARFLNCEKTEDGKDAVATLREGEEARMEIEIERVGNSNAAPREIWIETAWVRSDHCIVAQGRTRATLEPGKAVARARLVWRPWRLAEGEYRLAMALSPVDGDALSNNAIGDATGQPALHYDRRLNAAVVKSISSEASDLPVITHLDCRWET